MTLRRRLAYSAAVVIAGAVAYVVATDHGVDEVFALFVDNIACCVINVMIWRPRA